MNATKKTRKWSKKYKSSINCKSPKGFSQRQHCLSKRLKKRKSNRKTKTKYKRKII